MATIANLESEARALVDADSTSYTAADLLRRENAAYEKIVLLIQTMDGTWQFDDSSYTNFPVATTALVNSQNDYSFASDVLAIERVEVLTKGGLWQKLDPIDKSQIEGAIDEFYKTDGLPLVYDKQGNSLLLYPAPDNGVSVTLASGLKVYYKRTASLFTSAEQSTGTRTPGFASPLHYWISYEAALPYALSYKKDRTPFIQGKILEFQDLAKKFYGRRELDKRKSLSMKPISHR